jgi:hypothetical protein
MLGGHRALTSKNSGPPPTPARCEGPKNIREFWMCQQPPGALWNRAPKRPAGGARRTRLRKGWTSGIEPPTSGTTIRRSNQLSYAHHQSSSGRKLKGRQRRVKRAFALAVEAGEEEPGGAKRID